jgi:hypothetical protein
MTKMILASNPSRLRGEGLPLIYVDPFLLAFVNASILEIGPVLRVGEDI